MTKQILTTVVDTHSLCQTIKCIDLTYANLDSDEAVSYLGRLLVEAPRLKECWIKWQQGQRKVQVDIVYARETTPLPSEDDLDVAEGLGSITLIDKTDGMTELFRRPHAKLERTQHMQVDLDGE